MPYETLQEVEGSKHCIWPSRCHCHWLSLLHVICFSVLSYDQLLLRCKWSNLLDWCSCFISYVATPRKYVTPNCIKFFKVLNFRHNNNHFTTLCLGLPDELGPKVTFTHSQLSWSSTIFYQLPPSTTIHSILFFPVQFLCLTVFRHHLASGLLWSTSSSGTLYFILHTFLHPVVFLLQHMPIPSQPVLL